MSEYENLNKTNQPFFEEYQQVLVEIFASGWFILGKHVQSFENEFAAYCNTSHFVGVSSGLDALSLALRAFNFPKGSEVIVPSHTFSATILAIIQNELTPILVEPDIATYNINPALIEQHISSKTVAIIPVHLYGKCCDMDKIMTIANRHNLKVIEDAAQAHGALYKSQKAGTFGDIGAFSFYPSKNLGALGDAGGAIVKSDKIANEMRILRNYGSSKKYYNKEVGFNARLDEIQAAFLRIKLRKLDHINRHKQELAKVYLNELKDDFIKPVLQDNCQDVFHIFAIRHPKREQLREYLLRHGVKTEIHYPIAINRQEAFAHIFGKIETPIAQKINDTVLSLPIAYFHTQEDIYQVTNILNKF
jgi:dTDP-4-amino-4,6-dideoxygalactose transaminase